MKIAGWLPYLLACCVLSTTAHAAGTEYAKLLQRAYPAAAIVADGERVQVNGTAIVIDDHQEKNADERFAHADIEDMFVISYPQAGAKITKPQPGFDPGRFRCEALFQAIYGQSKKDVEKSLQTVLWLPTTAAHPLRVTSLNGVAEKLAAISGEIEQLPAAIRKYASHPAGAYNWRTIAGTDQLSAHSYGIAIDLLPGQAEYWRWRGLDAFHNSMPQEIVDIFERHGFIWGGRWYHYDTMHFEYRPELFLSPGASAELQQ